MLFIYFSINDKNLQQIIWTKVKKPIYGLYVV
jgi:hypothetical protein